MNRLLLTTLIVLSVAAVGLVGMTTIVSADDPFLCPVVGDGVLNADAHNGDNGVEAIQPPVGTSLLPGKNRAGEHANGNAHNRIGGPGTPDAGPGSPGFSPIWP